LKENFKKEKVRIFHAIIEEGDKLEVKISRGLPEGSRLTPALSRICVAKLILELRKNFPHWNSPEIKPIDDLNWIGDFFYVDDIVPIARLPSQLQEMINAYQDWAERSRMRMNYDKTKVMMFYKSPLQKASW